MLKGLLISLIAVCALIVACDKHTEQPVSEAKVLAPEYEIPVHQDAYNVKPYYSGMYKRATSYNVKIDYPATAVISYYNSEFSRQGYKELNNDPLNGWPIENYTWTEGSRDSMRSRQFMKYWTNDDESLLFILILRYETNLLDKWDDVLIGECQILDYNVQKTIMAYFKKLTEEGKDIEFFQLQSKYMNKDGEFDIEKAIKENPDKHYLQEYLNIMGHLSDQE